MPPTSRPREESASCCWPWPSAASTAASLRSPTCGSPTGSKGASAHRNNSTSGSRYTSVSPSPPLSEFTGVRSSRWCVSVCVPPGACTCNSLTRCCVRLPFSSRRRLQAAFSIASPPTRNSATTHCYRICSNGSTVCCPSSRHWWLFPLSTPSSFHGFSSSSSSTSSSIATRLAPPATCSGSIRCPVRPSFRSSLKRSPG
mmetsp:Transcript_25629/g.77845  ORF Transcript_25629/g.77845 Transcript_25629/m.77845 type:complete len:200 (-) Transcript_25629:1777-2376(-)